MLHGDRDEAANRTVSAVQIFVALNFRSTKQESIVNAEKSAIQSHDNYILTFHEFPAHENCR